MGKIYTAGSAGGTTSSDVTASRADILQDKYTVTTDSDDEVVGGTMPNRGAWTSGTSGNGRVGIPAGYHNGGGYVDGAGAYNSGVSAADNRENTNSVSYKNGYSKGVWDADARANPSSNNYQSGYNAGHANGRSYVVNSYDFRADKETNYYGQYWHRFSFNISSIPNVGSKTLWKDMFVCFQYYTGLGQLDVGGQSSGTIEDITNGVLHIKDRNTAGPAMQIKIYVLTFNA